MVRLIHPSVSVNTLRPRLAARRCICVVEAVACSDVGIALRVSWNRSNFVKYSILSRYSVFLPFCPSVSINQAAHKFVTWKSDEIKANCRVRHATDRLDLYRPVWYIRENSSAGLV